MFYEFKLIVTNIRTIVYIYINSFEVKFDVLFLENNIFKFQIWSFRNFKIYCLFGDVPRNVIF